jgi:hypothetical protein
LEYFWIHCDAIQNRGNQYVAYYGLKIAWIIIACMRAGYRNVTDA